MMKQFFDLKAKHPDAVLLFRCGDFYETYCEDAIVASKILGITLTKRNNGASAGSEMAGFPHHALDTYLPKLVRAGRRVAICDQLEDPKLTKKLVKRGITELVTPGVAMNDTVLNYKENNFLAAVHFDRSDKKLIGVSFLDISTGEFLTGEGTPDYVEKLLTNLEPREVLVNRVKKNDFENLFGQKYLTYELEEWVFTELTALGKLLSHFNVKNLKGFGIDQLKNGIISAGAILHYLEMTQHTNISHITSISRIEEEKYVRLDKFTIRSLELVQTLQEDGTSLLDVIDQTTTPMGGRMLRRWIVFPLRNENQINDRLDIVGYFSQEQEFRQLIDEQLRRIGDLERIISRVAVGRVSPREMVQLKTALEAIQPIKTACLYAKNDALKRVGERLNLCESMRERIAHEIEPEAPQLVNKGGVIRDGVNEELDRLRQVAYHGKDYLMKIQEREQQETGIQSLKIGYNNVFGYYLEVRNTYKDLVPDTWIRKQTLAQAERYITQELKEYEEKILGAQEKIEALEQHLYAELMNMVNSYTPAIQLDAKLIARLDVLAAFTHVALENHYCRPVVDDSLKIEITEGRHPVIEKNLPPGKPYITNTVCLDNDGTQIMMITGPNMSGKSALLRSTALNVLMAQMGCFVAAESAHIGIVDKIFTRVGASDNISLGESTFMVEMTEAASILNNMSKRSLILFDELGRGTSTYDGISIAWAIVEHIHNFGNLRPKTLFATHYHELNEMEKSFPRVVNYNVSVKEIDGKVVFLRKLERGGSEHSFGIHVAKLAGMPRLIVDRANEVLKHLEASNRGNTSVADAAEQPKAENGMQLSFFQLDDPILEQIRNEIVGLDINNLTPMAALNKLHDIKKIITGKD